MLRMNDDESIAAVGDAPPTTDALAEMVARHPNWRLKTDRKGSTIHARRGGSLTDAERSESSIPEPARPERHRLP